MPMDAPVTRAEYEEHNKRMDDEHARQNQRIAVLEKAVEENNKLLVSVEKLATSMENMQRELQEQGDRLEVLESRDGETMRNIVLDTVKVVVSIVVGFVFAKIGFN